MKTASEVIKEFEDNVMNLFKKDIKKCQLIADRIFRDQQFIGTNPYTIAATVIYLRYKDKLPGITQEHVGNLFFRKINGLETGVSSVAMRNLTRKLETCNRKKQYNIFLEFNNQAEAEA